MINNERQFRITRSQLRRLNSAAAKFNIDETAERCGSRALAEAELEALKSQASELSEQIQEFERLKSGAIKNFKATSLSELPTLLIRARIARAMSQQDLAKTLGLKEQQVQRYEAENYSSASLKRLAEVADALGLNISELAEFKTVLQPSKRSDSGRQDWERFPVKEMYKRNWFKDFSGTLNEAQLNAEVLLSRFLRSEIRPSLVALHHQRVRLGSVADPYALAAWQRRILVLARESPPKRDYQPGSITQSWLTEFIRQSRAPDGPITAKRELEKIGIPLVIEPHLPGTHLDGAALLDEQGPVIGMTLRYDRLDNFWFVLLHELVHVQRHLRRGNIEHIFDDLDQEPDDFEREADDLASEILLPDRIWATALARYTRSEKAINALAAELKISPAIIAGRIRKEANNFVILSNVVGHGEIRRLFPSVRFGS